MGLAMSDMTINLGEGRIELADETDTNVVKSKPFIPINPETGKPYFSFNDNGFDGVWTAQKVTPIPSSEFGGDDE